MKAKTDRRQGRLKLRECPECLCIGQMGTCHCDRDIYGPDCYKRGRHEGPATGADQKDYGRSCPNRTSGRLDGKALEAARVAMIDVGIPGWSPDMGNYLDYLKATSLQQITAAVDAYLEALQEDTDE